MLQEQTILISLEFGEHGKIKHMDIGHVGAAGQRNSHNPRTKASLRLTFTKHHWIIRLSPFRCECECVFGFCYCMERAAISRAKNAYGGSAKDEEAINKNNT